MEIVVKEIYMPFLQNSLMICEEATRVLEKDEWTGAWAVWCYMEGALNSHIEKKDSFGGE